QPDFRLRPDSGLHQIRSDAPQAISRAFRLTAVSIKDSQRKFISNAFPKNESIRPDAEVSVADPPRDFREILRYGIQLGEQKVVSERLGFDKRNHVYAVTE